MHITLNLLPEGQKDHLKRKRLFGAVLEQELYVLALALLVISILATILIVLNGRVALSEEIVRLEQQQSSAQSLKAYEELFARTATQLRTVEDVADKHLYWSDIFVALNDILIDGILLQELTTTQEQITLTGVAQNREILKKQREILSTYTKNEQPCFVNVDAPNEDIFEKEDIVFMITFEVTATCLLRE